MWCIVHLHVSTCPSHALCCCSAAQSAPRSMHSAGCTALHCTTRPLPPCLRVVPAHWWHCPLTLCYCGTCLGLSRSRHASLDVGMKSVSTATQLVMAVRTRRAMTSTVVYLVQHSAARHGKTGGYHMRHGGLLTQEGPGIHTGGTLLPLVAPPHTPLQSPLHHPPRSRGRAHRVHHVYGTPPAVHPTAGRAPPPQLPDAQAPHTTPHAAHAHTNSLWELQLEEAGGGTRQEVVRGCGD